MDLPNSLISSVGVSLVNNLKRQEMPASIRDAFARNELKNTADLLLRELTSGDKQCGAEINTIDQLLTKKRLIRPNADLQFCLSDTELGRATGVILEQYYTKQGHRVKCHCVEGLQDTDENRFRRQGLRNFVQRVGQIVREAGGPSHVALNATGGYKAQIALGVLIGQALGVTVYYKHENFPGVIPMPPMPIAFDYGLLGSYADLLDEMETKDAIVLDERFEIDPRLLPLLEEETVDGSRICALTAMGQTFLEGYRVRFPSQPTLPPAADSGREQPTFRDDHYPNGFREYAGKVWRTSSYVTGCHSLPYDGQRGIRDRVFYLRDLDQQIVGEYRSDFGARFAVNTTAKTTNQRIAVVQDLTARFGRN